MMLPRLLTSGQAMCCVSMCPQVMVSRGIRIKKVNQCYTPVCDAKIIEPHKDSQELCRAGRFMKEQYFPHEPVLKANSIVPTQTLSQYFQGAANGGRMLYSIVETKGGFEWLGLAIGHMLTKSSARDMRSVANRIKHKPTKNYMVLLSELERKIDVMALYNTERVLSIDVLCTMVDFRRRGVSKQLLNAMLGVACKEEAEMVKFITGSEYAAKSAAQAGFVTAYQGSPEALRDESGEMLVPNPLCLPHKIVRIMVKDLRLKSKS